MEALHTRLRNVNFVVQVNDVLTLVHRDLSVASRRAGLGRKDRAQPSTSTTFMCLPSKPLLKSHDTFLQTNIIYHLYVESKTQMVQMNLFTKQKQTHRLRKQMYGYQRGNVQGRDKLGVWD